MTRNFGKASGEWERISLIGHTNGSEHDPDIVSRSNDERMKTVYNRIERRSLIFNLMPVMND